MYTRKTCAVLDAQNFKEAVVVKRASWMRPGYVAAAVTFVMVFAAALAFVSGNNTVTAQSTVSFSQDIVPMFVESCTACHGGEEASSGSAGLNLMAPFAY